MKPIFPLFLFCIGMTFSGNLFAQKKAETKLYKAVIAAENTTEFNKFLQKYPQSVYANTIRSKRDSLIRKANTTTLSPREATDLFAAGLSGLNQKTPGIDFIAASERKDNIEYITGIIAPAKEAPETYRIVTLKESNGQWEKIVEKQEFRYVQEEALKTFSFVNPDLSKPGPDNFPALQIVPLNGEKYLLFFYENDTQEIHPRSKWPDNRVELVANLLSLSDGTLYSAMFSGERNNQTIEGTCSDTSQGGSLSTPQMDYLIKLLEGLDALQPFSKEKGVTRKAIEWWYDKNPEKATSLSFGTLDAENPIIQKFRTVPDKTNSASNTAAFFDIFETTVVCVYNKPTRQYLLVWCEPQSENPETDKTLNTLYFEKDNSLVLYYYQGNNAIKERINLINKQKR